MSYNINNYHEPNTQITNSEEALEMLIEGNDRFVENKLISRNHYEEVRHLLSNGQKPFAIILCCSDSRVSPEILFDQRLGDIFVIRNAGNIVDDAVLGSIEYGVEHLGCKLVVVLGHSHCGAVTACIENHDASNNVKSIIDKIKPSITNNNIEETAINNAINMANIIKTNSVVISENVKIVSGFFDIESGKVVFNKE